MRLYASEEIVCDVVHPNAGVEAWYRVTLQQHIHAMASEILQGLTVDWRTGKNTLAADAASLTTLVQRRMDAWARRWTGKWESMSERIAHDFATRNKHATEVGVMQSFAKAGFTVRFKPTRVSLDTYKAVVAENVGLIRRIPAQFLTDVQTQVWRGVTGGSDMNQMTKNIQKVYGISTHHASFIARDQNNKAKASLEKGRRLELGIVEAEWAHSGGGKEPRPTHLKAGQQRVRFKIAIGWLDPADNKRKQPGEDINCRCTSRAIIPGIVRRRGE